MFSAVSAKSLASDVTATTVSSSARGIYNERRSNSTASAIGRRMGQDPLTSNSRTSSTNNKSDEKEQPGASSSRNSQSILAPMHQNPAVTTAETSIAPELAYGMVDNPLTPATVTLSRHEGVWQSSSVTGQMPSPPSLDSDSNVISRCHYQTHSSNASSTASAAASVDCVTGIDQNNTGIVSAAFENSSPHGCLHTHTSPHPDPSQHQAAYSANSIKSVLVSVSSASSSSSCFCRSSDPPSLLSHIACNHQTIVDMESVVATRYTAPIISSKPVFSSSQQPDQVQKQHIFALHPSPRQTGTTLVSTGTSTESTTPLQSDTRHRTSRIEGAVSDKRDSVGIEDDVVMYSGDEDEDNTAENPPAISGEQYQSDDDRPDAPERALSEEHGSGTIRSLTALALSPTQQQQQQQQQQVSKTFIGGGNDNDDDGENDDKDIASAFDGSGTLLRSLLERVQNIEQYCRQLVQMQSQQAQHISALETTLQNTASNRTLSPRPGAASAGASESGAVSASTTASAATGVYPRTQQAHQTHGASGSVADSVVISPHARSRSPAVPSAAAISSSLSAATAMRELSTYSHAFGSHQGIYQTQYPQQRASAGPVAQQQQQNQIEASIQQHHHRRGSFGLQQPLSAGYQSVTPTSSSPNRRFFPYHSNSGGSNRAGPYSARTSPTDHTNTQRPAALAIADAKVDPVASQRARDAFFPSPSNPSSPGQHRLEPVPSTEATRNTLHVSRARSRRGSSSAQHGQQYRSGRHHISPTSSSLSSAWITPQQQQQHQQQHGVLYGAVDDGRHAVAPYAQAASQSQQQDVSAFGYAVPSASAVAHASATGSSSMPGGGSSGEQYSISQQLYAAASAAAARAKRPRVAELGSSLQYSPLASSSNSNVLPPIRVGIDPTPGAALGHGQMAEERSDSLQYSVHVAKDRKGKMAASSSASASADVVGVGASSGSARSAARGVKRAPNPEAQPTPGWLSTQRRYKVGLLHLLTLESFYPSDVAMLNTFRAQGDFTNEQIETHGAALLSWARSWLRYNRNAVLRSTLENKAKMPLAQLAEALQHDLHAETDFTAVHNMRRCALLRLIYYQWQAINKLGTKSQSLYRDYESRLREIEALPTAHEQEAEWRAILDEEQARRSALIRESRGSGGSTILPRPAGEQNIQQQRHRPPITSAMPRGNAPLILPLRSTVLDWPTHSATEATVLEQQQQQHYAQHYAVAAASMGSPSGGAQQQQREAMDVEGSQERRMQTVGKDDDSEMSVKLSPEPHH